MIKSMSFYIRNIEKKSKQIRCMTLDELELFEKEIDLEIKRISEVNNINSSNIYMPLFIQLILTVFLTYISYLAGAHLLDAKKMTSITFNLIIVLIIAFICIGIILGRISELQYYLLIDVKKKIIAEKSQRKPIIRL